MDPVDRDGSAGPAGGTRWLGWDGRTLRWRTGPLQPAALSLCIDGVAFRRFAAAADGEFGVDFDYSPTGNAELEFSIDGDDARRFARWRVVHGVAAACGVDQWARAPRGLAPLAGTPQLPVLAWSRLPAVAVVVPIYDAAASVRRCLAALARWTPPGVRRILVDDASSDPAIDALLAAQAARDDVRVERHAVNRGYTSAVNTGIAAAAGADVVLLNSDTEVGPRWLESLRLAAYGDERIGTVTAVSDNAGAFSVPEVEQYCPIPERWNLEQTQRAVLQQAGLRFPELPTGNGFCMFVKRALIERIGAMDAEAFPAGYGEENDFCQRAIAAGWRNVIAGNVFVRHERSASFGAARRAALGVQGMAVLRRRYPRYESDIGTTLLGYDRRVLDYRIRRTYAGGDEDARRAPLPRLLRVGAHGARHPGPDDGHELFALEDGPPTLSRIGADGSAIELARAAPQAGADDAVRAWLLAYAVESVRPEPGDAFAARVVELAADLGIPAAPPTTI